jgi:hypothetical protein
MSSSIDWGRRLRPGPVTTSTADLAGRINPAQAVLGYAPYISLDLLHELLRWLVEHNPSTWAMAW